MATATIQVNKEILEWVLRTSANSLSLEWIERVKKWIVTEKNPTVAQIQQLSKTSKLPFGYFFLNKPPKLDLPLLDFRTVSNSGIVEPTQELIDTVNEMQSKVSWLKDYRKTQGTSPNAFVGTESVDTLLSTDKQATMILHYFGLNTGWNLERKNAFNYLRDKVTNYGITVSVNGVVRNTRRRLNQNEFRAFALVDDWAPLIFINTRDSFNARLFSLVHELVHLWYGQSELLDFNFQMEPSYNHPNIEHKINAVTENILLPKTALVNIWSETVADTIFGKIIIVSKKFGVSPMVTAIRLKGLKLISQQIVNQTRKSMLDNAFLRSRQDKKGGPSFYQNLAYKTDHNFAWDVINSTKNGETSYSDLFDLLNVNGTHGLRELTNKLNEDEVNDRKIPDGQ